MSGGDKERTARDIENLVEIFNRSDWEEMHLKTDELEIFLSNDPHATLASAAGAAAVAASPEVTQSVAPTAASPGLEASNQTSGKPVVQVPDGMVAVTAPNLGTFYQAPKPGAAPYVEVGQMVDENTDVCLVEVMKLFTPVKAATAGKIHAICVEDGTMVEFGDVLVIIDPS
ncbi:MAG: acetyl-CoA carboxylase biotin carboxyl carrier protein [Gammaproteobacteria bacterium]